MHARCCDSHATFPPAQVNLLTPRIDYPPDASVERPSHATTKQRQLHERTQQLAQHQILQHQHPLPPAPAWPLVRDGLHPLPPAPAWPLVRDGLDGQQPSNVHSHYNLHNQYNQALHVMNLPPHQHQELLKLQLQLNHLQQLSLKQQMKTQQLEQDSSHLSPGSLSLKSGARLLVFHVETFYF
jgi:hypothetical protein